MPDNPIFKRRHLNIPQPAQQPVEQQPDENKPNWLQRAGGLVTRVGSGLLGGAVSSGGQLVAPGIASILGGAIGGAGDLAAQAIEEGSLNQLDRKSLAQAGVSAALTAVPGGAWLKLGKVGQSALRSGAITGAGEAAREKLAGEDLNPKAIAMSTGLGAVTGGVLGRMTRGALPPVPPAGQPFGPETLDGFIQKGTWVPEEIEKQAALAEARQQPDLARQIRDAAVKHNVGNTNIYSAAARAHKADITQDARNLTTVEKFQQKTTADAQKQAVEVEKAHEAGNQLRAKERVAAEKAFNQQAQEASEATAAARALQGIENPTEKTVITKTSTAQLPSGKLRATKIITAGDADAPAAVPAAPPEAPLATPTVVPKAEPRAPKATSKAAQNAVADAQAPEDAAAAAMTEAERAAFLAQHGGTNPNARPERRAMGPHLEGEGGPLLGGRRATDAPVTKGPDGLLVSPKVLDSRITSLAPEAPPAPPPALMAAPNVPATAVAPIVAKAEPAVAAVTEPTIAQQAAALPANPPLPEGTAGWMRFFRNPRLAQYNHDVQKGMNPEAQTALNNLYAQYEVANPTGKRLIGAKIQAVRKGFGFGAGKTTTEITGDLKVPVNPTVVPEAPPVAAAGPADPRDALLAQMMSKYEPTTTLTDDAIRAAEGQADQAQIASLQGTPKGGPKFTMPATQPPAQTLGWGAVKKLEAPKNAPAAKTPEELGPEYATSTDVAPTAIAQEAPTAVPKAVKGGKKTKGAIPAAAKAETPATPEASSTDYSVLPGKKGFLVHKPGADKLAGPFKTETDAVNWIVQDEAAAKAAAPNPGLASGTEKPRLVKNPKKPEGGTTLGSGLGGLQAIPGLVKKYPGFASKAAFGAAGAALGAVTDPLNDPFSSAVAGAALGASVPAIVTQLHSIIPAPQVKEIAQQLKTPQGTGQVLSDIGHLLPHIQRFNYLFGAHPLGANVIVGPWGSGYMGAMTKMLAGDPRGAKAIKLLSNAPLVWKSVSGAADDASKAMARAEAGDPLFRSELGGAGLEKLPAKARYMIQLPGMAMTAGDMGIRKILIQAGFSEAEAREITLTSEPFTSSMKKLVNMRRGQSSPLLDLLFPFVKTPANILEQGGMRIPGVGFMVHNARAKGGAPSVPIPEQVAQQLVGAAVGGLSYAAGVTLPPEQAITIRRYLTNAAGQYSLIASIGFTAGQAVQQGKKSTLGSVGADFARSIPLPTADPIMDAVNYISSDNPDKQLPRNMVPSIVREGKAMLGEEKRTTPAIPKLRRRKF